MAGRARDGRGGGRAGWRCHHIRRIATVRLFTVVATCLLATQLCAQADPGSVAKDNWDFQLIADGYVLPDQNGYFSPTITADRDWLHLEGRYNYENLQTGSLWVGYNFSWGKNFVFDFTPMIGGVFGRTTGVAPGCETSLTYRKFQLSISNEYVFDTTTQSGNFYYSWPQFTYSAFDWLKVGLVAQHSKVFDTSLNVQRGFLVGVSHDKLQFTTYVFNVGWTDPSMVLEVGYSF